MKVTFKEFEGCFSIELQPESIADCAQLVRLGINRTKEVRSITTHAYRDNTFSSVVVLGKRKNDSGEVKP